MWSEALTGVVRHQFWNPAIPNALYGAALGIEIRKADDVVTFPAFFDHGQVRVVGDLAVRMEIAFAVERVEDRVINVSASTGITLYPSESS